MLRAIDCGPTPAELLEVLDELREDVEAGRIVAIAGVAIMTDDNTTMFTGTSRPTTRLKTQGAIAQLQHWFLSASA